MEAKLGRDNQPFPGEIQGDVSTGESDLNANYFVVWGLGFFGMTKRNTTLWTSER